MQELFFCELNAPLNFKGKSSGNEVEGFGDKTSYSNLTRLQINIDIILFSNRQFHSFFDTTHTMIGMTCAHNSPSLTDLSPINPKRNFCSKMLKLRELFAFYTGRKFTLFTKQHYFTENRKVEKKISDTLI